MIGVKSGDTVFVDGNPVVFVKQEGNQVLIGRNGRQEYVDAGRVKTPGAEDDPPPDDIGFDALCSQFETLLHRLEADQKAAESRITRRRAQITRLKKVLRMLRGEQKPSERSAPEWTPEQRAAASDRMKQRNAIKKAGATA